MVLGFLLDFAAISTPFHSIGGFQNLLEAGEKQRAGSPRLKLKGRPAPSKGMHVPFFAAAYYLRELRATFIPLSVPHRFRPFRFPISLVRLRHGLLACMGLSISQAASDSRIIDSLISQPAATQAGIGAKNKRGDFAGTLEVQSLYLHAPSSAFSSREAPDQSPVWQFIGLTTDAVQKLLREADVAEPLRDALLATHVVNLDGTGVTLLPTPEHLLALTASSRQRIYETLAQWPANRFHATPLIIPAPIVDDWMAHTELSAEQRARMTQLFWRRGGAVAFSDLPFLIKTATCSRDVKAAMRAMTQTRGLMVKLRVPPTSDQVKSLAGYWATGSNRRDVVALLQSASASGVESLDLIHLLPPLCRRWLNAYPTLASEIGGRLPDCAWTSFNFFAVSPEPYYIDANATTIELKENYDLIESPAKLGDLICFADQAGAIVHTCVFIAGNIVFTKNGAGLAQPWHLVPYPDVEARYLHGAITRVMFYRKKAATPSQG